MRCSKTLLLRTFFENGPCESCRVKFEVTVCPIAGPESDCLTQRTGSTSRRSLLDAATDVATFDGLDPLTT